jgi:hypothetical protein
MQPTPRRCFAAANSANGFRNYYDEVFTEARVDRLYIIKGGPGTGKSRFMREIAHRARACGYSVTEYLCSSDPSSLDGILLAREGFPTLGFLDGTAPHTREPSLPGVWDEMIDLGAFWDSRRLTGQRESIRRLKEAKTAAYGRAYAYLQGVGALAETAEGLLNPCVLEERLEGVAARLLRGIPSSEAYETIPALRRAVSMEGAVTLHSFEEAAAAAGGRIAVIEEHYGLGWHLTAALLRLSEARRHRVWVSYDPILPHRADGLYYPDAGLCVLVGHAEIPEGCPARPLSLRRYIYPEALREVRGELRRAASLGSELTDAALDSLKQASALHFDLERIYSAAMDFRAKETFTAGFLDRLFGQYP